MKDYKKALFSLDCIEENIEGITYGYTWNGWACPYFTYENAMKLGEIAPDFNMYYHLESDSFICLTDDGFDTPEEFKGCLIDGVKYYPIGNSSWCWYDMTEEEDNDKLFECYYLDRSSPSNRSQLDYVDSTFFTYDEYTESQIEEIDRLSVGESANCAFKTYDHWVRRIK